MSYSRPPRLVIIACAVLAASCDASSDDVGARSLGPANLEVHGTGTTGSARCIDGADSLYASVYPKSISATDGEQATAYVSVFTADGGTVSASQVRWSISDTTIATIASFDPNGRPLAVGRAAGTTALVATCGDLSTSAPLTVSGNAGAPPPADTTTTKGPSIAVSVKLTVQSITPGQTAQATATTTDATGHPVVLSGVEWSSSNASVASVNASGLITGVGAGSTTINAKVGDSNGTAELSVAAAQEPTPPTAPTPPPTDVTPGSDVGATAPELPRSEVSDARFVGAGGRTIRVASGGDLQGALNDAQPGDQIVLAAGASYYGNFVLPAKATSNPCSAWTMITTETSLPSEGVRATPSNAGSFAKIITPNYDAALKTDRASSCWRIVGVELTVSPDFGGIQYGLIFMGDGYARSLSEVPQGIVLDRTYIHGQSSTNAQRCVALNSARSAIINSWVSDCHGRGFDSQAIAGWNGPGPYLIENNFIAGAGENIMFGGSDPNIPNLSPSDITIRRNHVWKDPSWKGAWTVKNLFELKHAKRVLAEGNVFENNWTDGQSGMAIVFKTLSDNASAPWTQTADVTFRYNIVRNSPRGFNLQGMEGSVGSPVARVRMEQNLYAEIGRFNGTEAGGWLNLITHNPSDVVLRHNTMVHNGAAGSLSTAGASGAGLALTLDYGEGQARRFGVDDNIFTNPNGYATHYSSMAVGTASIAAFAGNSWSFNRNVAAGVDPLFAPLHPSTSFYPSTVAAVGFVNAAGGDYRLSPSSPYKGKGEGGTDPGVDFDELARRTAGVVSR